MAPPKPARLTRGEKMLRSLVAHISAGEITASTDEARKQLVKLVGAARDILNGKNAETALGLKGRRVQAKKTFYRDLDMALHIHSELEHKGKDWPVVHRNINAWLLSQSDASYIDSRFRHQYQDVLSAGHMENVYSDMRKLRFTPAPGFSRNTGDEEGDKDVWTWSRQLPDLDDLGREYASRRLAEISRELLVTLYQGRNKLTAKQLADRARRAAESQEIWVEDIDVLAIAQECLEATRADSKQ